MFLVCSGRAAKKNWRPLLTNFWNYTERFALARVFIRNSQPGVKLFLYNCERSAIAVANHSNHSNASGSIDVAKTIVHGIWIDDSFINQTFTKLKACGPAFRTRVGKGTATWMVVCECECGAVKICLTEGLSKGTCRSCGCIRSESVSQRRRTHGGRKDAEYVTWYSMRKRCLSPTDAAYPRYGGRGITICAQWVNDYAQFLADMGPKPSPSHSIDRIDGNGNYEPSNCRWATDEQQCRNQSTSTAFTHNGETKTLTEWAKLYGISIHTLRYRVCKLGWSIAKALETPT